MLDYRIHTFLVLCDHMNYRAAAEALNLTQPAVTQHIQSLERSYERKLMSYSGRKLSLTEEGALLERYARSALVLERRFRQALDRPKTRTLRLGATKTIGEYVIGDKLTALTGRGDLNFSLLVDNTETLLDLLVHAELDLALVEGSFDKNAYGYRVYRSERFVGVCAEDHPFAGQEVAWETLFGEHLLCREPGSGTRAVLEQELLARSDSLARFARVTCVSSFEIIKDLVRHGVGISLVYEPVARSGDGLGTFFMEGGEIRRDFHYVFLKDAACEDLIALLEEV